MHPIKGMSKPLSALRTVKNGDRTLILRDSIFAALNISDPLPEDRRPIAHTHKQVQEMINASKSTIDRMILRGREQASA